MMADTILSPAQSVDSDHHDHHHRHIGACPSNRAAGDASTTSHRRAAAKRTWVALYNDIEHALGKDRELAPVRALASKAPEHISRLAGTFAVFEGVANVSENHIDRAAALMQHYLGEALRLWGTGQVSVELKLAQEVLNWLRDKMGPGRAIPLADIYRNGPAAIRSAGTARRVMQLLAHHGWVVVAEHPTAREAFELVAV
jgi:hypothetical protein